MAKRKKTSNKRQEVEMTTTMSLKSLITLAVVVIVIMGTFYLLTVVILNKKTPYVNNATINYNKIIAGEVFNVNKDEYLVFFFDTSSNDYSTYMDYVSRYRSGENKLDLYTVDMHDGMNKKYISEEDNMNATSAKDLKINGATLVHIKNGKIEEYIKSDFDNYLGLNKEEE